MAEPEEKQKAYPSLHVYFNVFTFTFLVISVLAFSLILLHQNKELTDLKEELDILREIYLGEQDGADFGNKSLEEGDHGRFKRQVNRYRNTQNRNTRYQNTRNTRLQNRNQQTRYQQNRNQQNRNQQTRYQQNRNQQNRNQQNRYQQNRNQQNRNQQNRNQQIRNQQNRNQQNRNQQNRNQQNRNQQNINQQNRFQQNRNQQNRNQQNINQQNRNQQNRNQQNRFQQNRNIKPKLTTTTKPTTAGPTTPRPTNKTDGDVLTAFINIRDFWSAVSKKPLTTTCKRVIKQKKQIICVKANGKNITIDAEGRRIINGSLDLGTLTIDRGSFNLIEAGREVSTASRNYIDAYVNHKLKTLLGSKITESKHLDEFIQTKVQEAIDKRLKNGLVTSPQLGKAQVIAIAGPPGPRGFPGTRGYRGPRGYSGPRGRAGLAAIVGPGGRVRWISQGNTGLFIGVPGKRGRRIKRQAGISFNGRNVGGGSTAGATTGGNTYTLGVGTVLDLEKLFGSETTGTTGTTTSTKLPFDSFVAPNITTKLKAKVVVKNGAPFNVTMRVTGYPNPESFWIKQGTRDVVFDQRLNFPKTKVEDSGIWTFRARNIMGAATAQFELVVGKKPLFVKELPKNVVAYEGRTFEFKCDVEAHPDPAFGFRRQGNAKLPAGRHKIIKDTLYLTDPKPEDAGLYLCRAANVMGAVIGGSRVYVQKIAPLTVKILSPAELVYKDTSRPLKLNCSATGNPRPNITWYKDGVPLKAKILVKRPTRINPLPEFLSQLVIDQVSTKDEGTYTCSIQTSLAPIPTEYNTTVSLFKCKALEAPANGYIVGKSFHVGACIKFACNPGCMLYGSAIRVCNSHGKWSGTAPTCYDVGEVAYECHHYNVLSDSDRNVHSKRVMGRCDNNLAEGWYRFSGDAGTQMPSSCQGPRKCNAKYPGWLYGMHPRKEDGCIQTHVCFGDYKSNCCAYKKDVLVRNCGKFYVYKFSPSPGCNMRYCAKD